MVRPMRRPSPLNGVGAARAFAWASHEVHGDPAGSENVAIFQHVGLVSGEQWRCRRHWGHALGRSLRARPNAPELFRSATKFLRNPQSKCHKGMKAMRICLLFCAALCAQIAQPCGAQTNVTGVVVDKNGKPIASVRCSVSGFPQPSGGRTMYTGLQRFVFTDKEGHFSIPLPRGDPLVDLQFDGGSHAPTFLYKVRPADPPLRVVMMDG